MFYHIQRNNIQNTQYLSSANRSAKNRSSAAVKTWLHNQIRKRKAQDISLKNKHR